MPTWSGPDKNCGLLVFNELPCVTTVHTCCHNSLLGGNKHTLCDHWGKTFRSLHVLFSRLCTTCLSFADFALYPFVVMSHNCECDYLLSPVSRLSESSNLGVVLKTRASLHLNTAIPCGLGQFPGKRQLWSICDLYFQVCGTGACQTEREDSDEKLLIQ